MKDELPNFSHWCSENAASRGKHTETLFQSNKLFSAGFQVIIQSFLGTFRKCCTPVAKIRAFFSREILKFGQSFVKYDPEPDSSHILARKPNLQITFRGAHHVQSLWLQKYVYLRFLNMYILVIHCGYF